MTGQNVAGAASRMRAADLVARVSSSERRVLDLIVDGHSLIKIADELALSLEEMVLIKTALLRKLEAKTTADLVRIGLYAQAEADH